MTAGAFAAAVFSELSSFRMESLFSLFEFKYLSSDGDVVRRMFNSNNFKRAHV